MSLYGNIRLLDICNIERCRSGIVYPAGTCYIQVSACAKNSAEKWHITEESMELPGKFAAVFPKVPVIPLYLREALEYTAEEFFCRYIGSSINISMELFKFYILPFHFDLEAQRRVLDVLKPIREDIKAVEKEIEGWKKLKMYFMNNMYI